jgi:hypothetical protein
VLVSIYLLVVEYWPVLTGTGIPKATAFRIRNDGGLPVEQAANR